MEHLEEENIKIDRKISSVDASEEKFRVLVVEDDKTQWPLWENILSGLNKNMEVDWLISAEDAQALLKQAYHLDVPYDLVVSDIFLAGRETGADLWNHYGEAAKHFLFVSGEVLAQSELLRGLDFGSPVFLAKPIAVEKCKRILQAMCKEDSQRGFS